MKNLIFNKRALSFLLTLLMIVGVFPAGAFVVSASDDGVLADAIAPVAEGNVAKIGETEYATLAKAVAAAKAGDTIELIANTTSSDNVTISKAITINGNGNTIGGTVSLAVPEDVGTMTFENVVFKTANTNCLITTAACYNVTFDTCTFNGAASYTIEVPSGGKTSNNFKFNNCTVDMTTSFYQGSGQTYNLSVNTMTVKNCDWFFKVNYGASGTTLPTASFSDVTVENALVFICAQNHSKQVFNIENCNVKAMYPVLRWDKTTDAYEFYLTGINSLVSTGNQYGLPELANYPGVFLNGPAKNCTFKWDVEKPTVTVSAKAERDAAIAAAEAGDVIKLANDLTYDGSRINIDKAITLDLNGKTITTNGSFGAIKADGGCSIKNGKIVYTGTNAVIKVWNVKTIENLVIEAINTSGATIGGIVIQEGSTVRVDSIKNVTIKGAGLTNGIQTYNCGTAKENVIGSMENVNIDAVGVAMNIYAPCGTATNCTFKGGNYGIEIWIKGTYNATLDLVNCTVEGGGAYDVFAHDEFKNDVTNNGTLKLTADAATGLDNSRVHTDVMHGSNVKVENEGAAQAMTFRLFYTNRVSYVAKIGEIGYKTLSDAIEAAKDGDIIVLLADNAEEFEFAQNGGKITIDGNGKTFTGKITLNAGFGELFITNATLTPSNADAKSIVLNAATAPDITIDDCTMKNVGTKGAIVWGQASSTANKVVIKNSTASNLQYLVGTNQAGCEDVTIENVTATNMAYLIRPMKAVKVTVKNVTYSGLTFVQVKNSVASTLAIENVTVTTTQAGMPPVTMLSPDAGNVTVNYTITLKGENVVNGEEMTPATENAWFATAENGLLYEIKDLNRQPSGSVAYRADVTDKTDREGIAILLKEVYAKESVVVKVYHNDTLMFVCTRRNVDDEGKVMFPVDGNTTANIVLGGKESGSWINEILVAPTELNVPNKIEVYADDVLVDTYTHESGTVLGTNLNKYLALDCVEKYVAKVGDTYYTDIQEAIKAAAPAGTVELLADVTVDKWITISETLTIGDGSIITLAMNGLTINGNGHTITINEIESPEREDYLFHNATNLNIKDLTIKYVGSDAYDGGISLKSGTIENVTFEGGKYGVLPGEGNVIVKNCIFNGTNSYAIYYEAARDNLVVTGNTFNTADGAYAITMRSNEQFTGNTIIKGKVNLANSAKSIVTGNDFGTERFKVYNGATANISENKINNLVFNDSSIAQSTFNNNTLSVEAQAALDAVTLILGDIDGNREVNVMDVILLRKYIVGLVGETEINKSVADLNEDGIINVLDVVLLRLLIADNN